MKAVVLEKGEIRLKDIPKPSPSENEALVEADFPLDRIEEAFATAQKPDVIKVLLTP